MVVVIIEGHQFLVVVTVVDYLLDAACAAVAYLYNLLQLNIFLRGFLWGKQYYCLPG